MLDRTTDSKLFAVGLGAVVIFSAFFAGAPQATAAVGNDETPTAGNTPTPTEDPDEETTDEPGDETTEEPTEEPPDDGESSGFAGTLTLADADTAILGSGANATAGWSVADAGDVNGDGMADIIVGAPFTNSTGESAGAAYIFFGPVETGEMSVSNADVVLQGDSAFDLAGWSVSTAGDLDGDGADEVIVGAPLDDTAGQDAGAAYVVYGGEDMPDEMTLDDADSVLYGNASGEYAGWSVADVPAADDETGSVLVGAPLADAGATDSGVAYRVDGDSLDGELDLGDADARFLGESTNDRAGWTVSAAGDVDDDGVAEALVGAPGGDAEGVNNLGVTYVVDGTAEGTVELADSEAQLYGENGGDWSGWSVADAGDVNDDGVDDIIVGAPYSNETASNAGAAYVVYGGEEFGGESSLADADVRLYGESQNDLAGWSVSAAGSGDVSCDTIPDVLVGAPYSDAGGTNSGAAYLVTGGDLDGEMTLGDATAQFVGATPNDRAGYSVSEAGNVDGVDIGDILIGAPDANRGAGTGSGVAYVLFSDCDAEPPTETPAGETPTETPDDDTDTPTPDEETDTPTDTPTETTTPDEETDTPTDTPTETTTPDEETDTPTDEPDDQEEEPGDRDGRRTATPGDRKAPPEPPGEEDETPTETPDDGDETPTETPDDGNETTEASDDETTDTPTETPTPDEETDTPTDEPENETTATETPAEETPEEPQEVTGINSIAFCVDGDGEAGGETCPEGEELLVRFIDPDGNGEFGAEDGMTMGVSVFETRLMGENDVIEFEWESTAELSSVVVNASGTTCVFDGGNEGTAQACGLEPEEQTASLGGPSMPLSVLGILGLVAAMVVMPRRRE